MARTIDVDGRSTHPDPQEPRDGGIKMFAPKVISAVLISMAAGLLALMAITGRLGVANVGTKEVAVVVNYISGAERPVLTPGYCFYLPFIEEVFIFDRSMQEFLMKGGTYSDSNHVPQLTVRASDGSSFYFEEMPIQYQVRPEMVTTLLQDSGPGDRYKEEWVKAHARSILRDEFGRFTPVEAANPTVFLQAQAECKRRLNVALEPHGIEVVLIGTPTPKFDKAYEQAIEDRKSADQEVERLEVVLDQLVEERDQKLAAVERQKSVEMAELTGELKKELLESERQRIQVERGADAYAARRRLEGAASKAGKTEEARGLVARYSKEAEGLASQAKALELKGDVVVREALVKKLTSIDFTLVPYSRDPQPTRLEHVDAKGMDAMAGSADEGGGN
ncbi:MAG: SPFH domain-containing protein [Planctomycetota bacterium]|nr:SPFH domain-containing protein [Planctomycetota bacterium]MDP6937317.1 SPFH domain-containing protein [Planctomycetota bacterium]